MSSQKKNHIILDLDETLIHSVTLNEENIKKYSCPSYKEFNIRTMGNSFIVIQRPFLQEFLDFLFDNFLVSVWTASSELYCDIIVSNYILTKKNRKLKYILNSSNCKDSIKTYGNEKDLNLLTEVYKLQNLNHKVFLIDDKIDNVKHQKNNAILVKKFLGNKDDKTLISLKNFLRKFIS